MSGVGVQLGWAHELCSAIYAPACTSRLSSKFGQDGSAEPVAGPQCDFDVQPV